MIEKNNAEMWLYEEKDPFSKNAQKTEKEKTEMR